LMQSFGINGSKKPDSRNGQCVEFTTIEYPENERRKRPKQITSVVDGLMQKSLNMISESRNRFLSRSFKKVKADADSSQSSFRSLTKNLGRDQPNLPLDTSTITAKSSVLNSSD